MMRIWNFVFVCMHAFSSLLHPDVLHSRMKLFAVGKSLLFGRYSLSFSFFYLLIFSFTIEDVFHKSPESQSVRTSWKWQHFSRNIFFFMISTSHEGKNHSLQNAKVEILENKMNGFKKFYIYVQINNKPVCMKQEGVIDIQIHRLQLISRTKIWN